MPALRSITAVRLAFTAAMVLSLLCNVLAEETAVGTNETAVDAGTAVNGTSPSNTTAAIPAGFNADGSLKKTTTMDPPQVSVGGIAGLLVGFVLLLILVPGLICLYKIESPQTFDTMDKDDAKKKMQ